MLKTPDINVIHICRVFGAVHDVSSQLPWRAITLACRRSVKGEFSLNDFLSASSDLLNMNINSMSQLTNTGFHKKPAPPPPPHYNPCKIVFEFQLSLFLSVITILAKQFLSSSSFCFCLSVSVSPWKIEHFVCDVMDMWDISIYNRQKTDKKMSRERQAWSGDGAHCMPHIPAFRR